MASSAQSRPARVALQQSTLDAWLSTQRSPNTRAAYRCDLETFGNWCARQGAIALTADTATLVAFQAAREASGDSDSTRRRRWSALSSFYDFAVDQGVRSINPARGVDRPKVLSGDPSPTVQLSEEAVSAYRTVAAGLDHRLDALVALLVIDGLKVAEALALDIEDVAGRHPRTTINVRRRGQSKRIALDPDSARAVRRCVGQRRTGPVFVNERSAKSDQPHRLTRFGADHLIRQLRNDDAAAPVTANALRRFHINSAQAGGDVPDDVRDRAGLAHVRSVRRYDATATRTTSRSGPNAAQRRTKETGDERSA